MAPSISVWIKRQRAAQLRIIREKNTKTLRLNIVMVVSPIRAILFQIRHAILRSKYKKIMAHRQRGIKEDEFIKICRWKMVHRNYRMELFTENTMLARMLKDKTEALNEL